MSAQVMVKAGTVRRVGAALGAEVIGLDLAESCDQITLDWIRDALSRPSVSSCRRLRTRWCACIPTAAIVDRYS